MNKHEWTEAERGSHGMFHNTSWSFAWKCPICGRAGRFNQNFLGRRQVYCNGEKFVRVLPCDAWQLRLYGEVREETFIHSLR